jgi:aspartyl-tRNA(Asn)/glutamyl-tRNA(Gln) amidotransferase subunit A
MQSTTELHHLTIQEAHGLLEKRKLSPVELTQAFLDRIEQTDGTLQAYITILADSALSDARIAEADIKSGTYKGPLHGIPIALKDLYDTEGVRTTASSRVLADRVPTQDATTTARLKASGAILLGKLAMHEFALGGPDPTCGFPLPRNPWNLEHVPGGSSSGSGVAVAAGLCMAALGSCTGGSIRGPASHCGIVGLKATYGRVSRYGVVPLAWTLDHCGPLTWSVEDAAFMLQAIAGNDPKDPTTSVASVPDYSISIAEGIQGLKMGVPRHFFFGDDPRINREALAVVETALGILEGLGASVEEVSVPMLEYVGAAHPILMLSEAFAYHQQNLRDRPQDFGEMSRSRFLVGGLFSSGDYVQAQRVRNVLNREFAEVLKSVDLIASPTMSSPPGRFDEVDLMANTKRPSFTSPYNMTGMPAISVPCGFTPSGLPVGLQLAGRPWDEPTVLRAAYAYQQATEWHSRRPSI